MFTHTLNNKCKNILCLSDNIMEIQKIDNRKCYYCEKCNLPLSSLFQRYSKKCLLCGQKKFIIQKHIYCVDCIKIFKMINIFVIVLFIVVYFFNI